MKRQTFPMNRNRRKILALGVAGGMDPYRRRMIGCMAAALTAPRLALAQTSTRAARVTIFILGVLPGEGFNSLPWHRKRMTPLFADSGFDAERNLALSYVALEEASSHRVEGKARDVVASRPDLIFALGTEAAQLFQRLTLEIPIVFSFSADPLREGLVQSYRRPGGNLTGTSSRWYEMLGKRLELVKELRPAARRVALLMGPGPYAVTAREGMTKDASRLGLELVERAMPKGEVAEASTPRSVSRGEVAESLRIAKADAFFPIDFYGVTKDLVWIQERSGTPGFFSHSGVALGGGLVSLGISDVDQLQRSVAIAARILRGEKPSEIPVDQQAKFHLVVNLKTARAMKIDVPVSILIRADRVVE